MLLLALLAVLSGALTRALGIGYSLLMAPAAAALLAPGPAVALVLAIGVGLGGALLLVGRRQGVPATGPGVRALVAGGVAGQVAAAVVVGPLDAGALRIVAGVALVLGCVATVARPPARPAPAALGLPAGAAIGAVGLLTGITGPFAAVWLARRSGGGAQLRQCVFFAVATLSASGLALQAAFGAGPGAVADGVVLAALLAPAFAVGAVLGGPAAARLTGARHRLAVAAVAALGAAVLLAGT